jgi:hypothetical protein
MDNAQKVNNWITFARNLDGLVKLFSFRFLHKYKAFAIRRGSDNVCEYKSGIQS